MSVPFNVNEAINTGFFVCGTSQSGKTNLAKWLVRALLDSGIVVYVLDTSQAWTHDTPINKQITIRERQVEWKGSTVFDISPLETREKIAFVNSLCKAIYERHLQGYNVREFIVFEEAQTYLPNGCLRLAIRRSSPYESVLDIVTVGANYRIRFGLITQFPAMVDKAPVKISMQRYFGWTWEKNDVAYLRGFLGKEVDHLRSLERGQFLYQLRDKTMIIQTKAFGKLTEPKISRNSFEWSFKCSVPKL
jgi:DNA helicase HerA-like ATPase